MPLANMLSNITYQGAGKVLFSSSPSSVPVDLDQLA